MVLIVSFFNRINFSEKKELIKIKLTKQFKIPFKANQNNFTQSK